MEWCNPFSSSALLTLEQCECGTLAQHEVVEKEDPPPINPYDILHLRRDATTSEVRKAFRRLGLLHHPGRTCTDEEQQQRRIQLFDLLSAAYETLVNKEARRRYDLHLSSMENRKYTRGLAGEMYVGGKRMGTRNLAGDIFVGGRLATSRHSLILANSESEAEPEVVVPELVRSDSASTFSSVASGESFGDASVASTNISKKDDGTKRTAQLNRIDFVEQQRNQISEEEKERILEGPLKDLFEARGCVPFSDSLVVFEQVFGSKVFETPIRPLTPTASWDEIKSLSSYPAGWEGSSKTSPDGRTRVFTTTRILYGKRVTRIETFTDDPVTGARTKSMIVTSQPIQKDVVEEEVQACFTVCGNGAAPRIEQKMSDEEPLLLKNEEEPSSSCFCKDLLHSYCELCSQLYDEFRMIGLGYFNILT
ncbi:unnamed protein product [Cylindrotheca closterium]|uniref:J domain-containing protein n=1 Tax=Cylindrotheca closterium TaxID=2856 RepID=A0AAD2G3K2_9STRA|nr:unnamed protein product [Cylindrotheca closterium]